MRSKQSLLGQVPQAPPPLTYAYFAVWKDGLPSAWVASVVAVMATGMLSDLTITWWICSPGKRPPPWIRLLPGFLTFTCCPWHQQIFWQCFGEASGLLGLCDILSVSWVGGLVLCEGFDLLYRYPTVRRPGLCYTALLWCLPKQRISADQKFECMDMLCNLIGLSRIPNFRLEDSCRKWYCIKIILLKIRKFLIQLNKSYFLWLLVCGFQ